MTDPLSTVALDMLLDGSQRMLAGSYGRLVEPGEHVEYSYNAILAAPEALTSKPKDLERLLLRLVFDDFHEGRFIGTGILSTFFALHSLKAEPFGGEPVELLQSERGRRGPPTTGAAGVPCQTWHATRTTAFFPPVFATCWRLHVQNLGSYPLPFACLFLLGKSTSSAYRD